MFFFSNDTRSSLWATLDTAAHRTRSKSSTKTKSPFIDFASFFDEDLIFNADTKDDFVFCRFHNIHTRTFHRLKLKEN